MKCKMFLASVVVVTIFWAASMTFAKKKGGGGGGAYDLVPLVPPDATFIESHVNDLNDLGNVVGQYANSAHAQNGFYYDAGLDVYLIYGPGISVSGLNDLEEMVGGDVDGGVGLYWSSPTATPIPLPPLPGDTGSRGWRLNNAGIVIGSSWLPGSPPIACAWKITANTVSAPIVLPYAAGDERGTAQSLNEPDAFGVTTVVGRSGTLAMGPDRVALAWELTSDAGGNLMLLSGPTDLGSLGQNTRNSAHGVNVNRDIVGQSDGWPFYLPSNGTMQPLPGLPKATNGYALGINDVGQMVGDQGYLHRGRPVQKAVLWNDSQSVTDLNKSVPGKSGDLRAAHGINSSGDIIGTGVFPDIDPDRSTGYLLIKKP